MIGKKDKSLGKRVELALKMSEFRNQSEMALSLGITHSSLSQYRHSKNELKLEQAKLIASGCGVSPAWLLFGYGPIRPESPDQQAVRYQNYSRIFETVCMKKCDGVHKNSQRNHDDNYIDRLAADLGCDAAHLKSLYEEPKVEIGDQFARKLEHVICKTEGWMDEQHIDNDPVLMAFPRDIRDLMTIFSETPVIYRALFFETMKTISAELKKLE